MMSSNWKKVLASSAIVAVVLTSAVACGPAVPEVPATPEEDVAEVPATPEEDDAHPGGTLRLTTNREPETLDPHLAILIAEAHVYTNIFDSYLHADRDGNLQPNLATAWEVSEDAKEFTFYLREDVKFHDGTPFNAEAVKYNFDRLDRLPALQCDMCPFFESAEVIDEYTVRIRLNDVYGPFLTELSRPTGGTAVPISPAAGEELGDEGFGLSPVGTGPFMFVEWAPQERIVLARNPDYEWAPDDLDHSGPPLLDRVEWLFLPESAPRVGALEAGEVQLVFETPGYDEARLVDLGFVVEKGYQPGWGEHFIFNTNKPPTDDVRVRLALNRWFDRDLFNQAVYGGGREPQYAPLSPATPCHSPEAGEVNALDREGALELLAEAGWDERASDGVLMKDGERLRIVIYGGGTHSEHAESVAAQFSEIADAPIELFSWAAQRRIAWAGEHNLIMEFFSGRDPNIMRKLLHSDEMDEEGWVFTHFDKSNPELQAELDELLDVGLKQYVELEQRCPAYVEAQQLVVENALSLPLSPLTVIYTHSPELQGFTMRSGVPVLLPMWLEQ